MPLASGLMLKVMRQSALRGPAVTARAARQTLQGCQGIASGYLAPSLNGVRVIRP